MMGDLISMWLVLGVIGWAGLILFNWKQGKFVHPDKENMYYIPGFVFSLVLGPIVIGLLLYRVGVALK